SSLALFPKVLSSGVLHPFFSMNKPQRTSVNAQPRNCLICTVPIQECHLGIDSCRACSVFYKRTIRINKELIRRKKGTDDYVENEPTTSCRKCRFRKFCDVLSRALKEDLNGDDDTVREIFLIFFDYIFQDDELESDLGQSPSTSFIDHNSFTLTPSFSKDTPLLSRIRHGYSLLCVVRKACEFHAIPDDYAPTAAEIESNQIAFLSSKVLQHSLDS
ncbi:hypothetical protein PRIPAC_79238, partial [Pristionchus pacificus]